LTRERLASDLDAFQRAGGTIEVLGITRARDSTDSDSDSKSGKDPSPATPAPARSSTRGGGSNRRD
jgi:hypothetical protein